MTSPRGRRAAARGIAAATLVATAACATRSAAPPAPSPAQPVVSAVPVVLDSTRLRLPVQDYMLSTGQLRTVALARVRLVEQCLARYGVRVALPRPETTAAFGPRSLTDRRYGITDAALAARHAFGLGPRDPSLQKKPPQPALGVEGRAALTGQGPTSIRGIAVSEGGCLAEADTRLDAGLPARAQPELAQQVQFMSFEQSKSDSRVRDVFTAWSACMGAAGYHYANPLGTVGDPRYTGSGPASKAAIKAARTDLACKRKTNLVGIWFSVDAAYQAAAIADRAEEFRVARHALDQRLSNARAVLSAGRRGPSATAAGGVEEALDSR